jgi:hypothetical protein
VLNPARWTLKGSVDFGLEPRKALIGNARAFDVAVGFGLPLNLLRSPYCGGPNEIGEGHKSSSLAAGGHPQSQGSSRKHNQRTDVPHTRSTTRGTRAIQVWLGHRSITITAAYTTLAPNRFKDFWR